MVKDEECQDVREEEGIRKDFHGNWSMPKPCDACRISSALLYCRADSAYLCLGCDVKVHGANKLASRHERVWMCEVCEQAPAVVTCKADAAALCVSCDADIHSANPLARRHERVPVIPFYECSTMVKAAHINVPSLFGGLDRNCDGLSKDDEDDDHLYAAEAASWLLTNPKHVSHAKNGPVEDAANPTTPFIDRLVNLNDRGVVCPRMTRDKCSSYKLDMQASGIDFFPEIDPYLDLEYASMEGAPTATDSVVPVKNQSAVAEHASAGSECLDADVSCKGGFSYTPTTSLSHSVSSSSLDVGVVPDGTLNDISTPYHMSPGVFELPTPAAHGSFQYVAMDREARVLRYKEKRKNRKFEKTIRYASRKAYAETRPRIKGRFAKRTDADVEQMYASSLISDSGYGVVPSF